MPVKEIVSLLSLCLSVSFLVCVTGGQINITAEPGDNVTLPCRAPSSSEISYLIWNRPDLKSGDVLWYSKWWSEPDNQHPSFKERVELKDSQMKDGDLSVTLKNVTFNDTGTYKCSIFKQEVICIRQRPKLISTVHLRVVPAGHREDGGDQGGGDMDGGDTDGGDMDGGDINGGDVDGGDTDGGDTDGGDIDGGDIDGGDMDGGDTDGGDIDGGDIDGGDMDGRDMDGRDMDGGDMDGGDMDGRDMDGGDMDGEDMYVRDKDGGDMDGGDMDGRDMDGGDKDGGDKDGGDMDGGDMDVGKTEKVTKEEGSYGHVGLAVGLTVFVALFVSVIVFLKRWKPIPTSYQRAPEEPEPKVSNVSV